MSDHHLTRRDHAVTGLLCSRDWYPGYPAPLVWLVAVTGIRGILHLWSGYTTLARRDRDWYPGFPAPLVWLVAVTGIRGFLHLWSGL